MGDKTTSTSKLLSLVLRHQPDLIGIALDDAGWVAVDDLLEGCRLKGHAITFDELQRIVQSSDKQRFALSGDLKRIRANQGHSVAVELGYEPAVPPEVLYHGTADRFLGSIRKSGLEKRARHHVHLSDRTETAAAVGSRHGKLVVLEVAAGVMYREGITFFRTTNGVWLTDNVPVRYLVFP
jgi:putative RNA 2'-phosphotransferase